MSPNIPEDILNRLIKICGMFGSDGVGERGNAAQHADTIIKSLGFTWETLLRGTGAIIPTVVKPSIQKHVKLYQISDVLLQDRLINTWQYDFLQSTIRFSKLSPKQQTKINEIWIIAENAAYV